ncbi:cytoskeletal protein RodZ [Bradyrhizobium sp. S3.12.5]
MLFPERDQRHFEGGLSDTVLDARRMSTSIAAQSYAARKPKNPNRNPNKNPNKHSHRKSSRKMTTQNVLGAAVIGCVVLAGWTVYNNIFAASVYPTVGSSGYDEPVVKRAPKVALREAGEAIRDTFALLPDRLQVAAPISREMFNERFAAAATQGIESNAASAAPAAKVADAKEAAKPTVVARVADVLKSPAKAVEKIADAAKTKRADAPVQLASADPAEIVPAPEAKPKSFADRAKAAVMSITGPRQSMVEKLWGKREPSGGLLAYASADASVTASIAPKEQNPMLGGSPPYDRSTAVYDITAKTVYLPDGTRLEAHSGLGSNLDDPRSSRVRMRGVTPPHIYELKPREALFHGVPALRLTPVGGENAIYGRDGLLAHTFMLGPNGDSNGCVSFKDYYAFLDAYRNKGIRRLAVLARVD